MKKNLLALVALSAMYSASAQDTYIKDAVIVKVNPSTLFYNGGNVNVKTDATSGTTEKIINNGNIQIQGGFTNENTIGKNFVNKYIDSDSFGQLIIKDGTNVEGRIAIERSIPDLNNDEYVISLPFKGVTAKEVINSITGGDFFKGNCLINTNCGNNRYLQSLFFWDVTESEYDAIDTNFTIDPKYRYLLNLRNGTAVNQALSGESVSIMFAGFPNNDKVTHNLKSGLKGGTFAHANQAWKEWKTKINNYNETYNSYLGNQTGSQYDNSLIFGKNQHRLSNPFTSNLDLSDVSKTNSWIKFIGITGSTPTEVYQNAIRFRVTKIANDFTIKWNGQVGNTTSVNSPVSAYLSHNPNSTPNYFWTGNPQALLVKPYESFYIDYYAINSSGNNNSRIVEAEVKLNDTHKTFDYDFSNRPDNGSGFPVGTFNRNAQAADNLQSLLNDESLKQKGLVTDFDFTQVEIFLSKNNKFEGSAAYLLNANFMKSGSSTAANTITNPIFLYEENEDGEVINTAQTLSNSFNSIDYIGKPLRLGFYNLVNGEQYSINLNLYEYSILNKVDKLNLGKYYIVDKETNKVQEINADTQIDFVANDKVNDRFEFYWNELPKTLSTDDLNTKNVTYLYDNNDYQYVRFEKTNTTADIAIFDLTGRQISYKTNISTSSDHKLDLPNVAGVFIVKIVYKDGKVVTKKTINN